MGYLFTKLTFFIYLTYTGDIEALKANTTNKVKKKRITKRQTIEVQLEILRRFENGNKTAHIGRDLGIPESTVREIVKRRDKLYKYKQIGK